MWDSDTIPGIVKEFDLATLSGDHPSLAASRLLAKHSNKGEDQLLLILSLLLIGIRIRKHEIYDRLERLKPLPDLPDANRVNEEIEGHPGEWAVKKIKEYSLLLELAESNRSNLRLFDLITIPLDLNRFAFAHYGMKSKEFGELFWIYGTSESTEVGDSQLLFGPVKFGYRFALKEKIYWINQNSRMDAAYEEPMFISGSGPLTHSKHAFWLWTESGEVGLGSEIPAQYRHLERQMVWPLIALEDRIRTGHNPYQLAV